MPATLVVDDNTDLRSLLSRALELEGYSVSTAENGQDAINKLRSIAVPCVILLDMMMPVMDGVEFLKWKTAQPNLDMCPVIVLSAVADQLRPPGAVAYLQKPVDLGVMLEIVNKFCPTA